MGDDVIDQPVMEACGLAIATANARVQVKEIAHWVTPNGGGHGAGRDAIDYILEAQDKLEYAIEALLDANNPATAAADIDTGKM